jgi:hypothetical protein
MVYYVRYVGSSKARAKLALLFFSLSWGYFGCYKSALKLFQISKAKKSKRYK